MTLLHPPLSRPIAAMTIAGSDSGGGAGIQADLRTFAAHGLLGCTAVTAVTAQNTLGVRRADAVEPEMVVEQIRTVLGDLPVRAVKTGMLANAAIVRAVASSWVDLRDPPPLVVDPVMVSKSGHGLLDEDAVDAMRRMLLPLCTVFTPNLPEAAKLLDIDRVTDPEEAVAALSAMTGGRAVVVLKGGHTEGTDRASDLVRMPSGRHFWLDAPRVDTRSDHGTGCTFSAAIAANLATGDPVDQALLAAKSYLTGALRVAAPMGAGHGPVDHLWWLRRLRIDDEP